MKLKRKNALKVGLTDGSNALKKIILGLALVTMLAGCNDGIDAFGIKLDSNSDQLKRDGLVKSENLIPSKQHFLEIQLNKAPEPALGDAAVYSVNAVNGKVIGARGSLDDAQSAFYKGAVEYAKSKLGDPIATEKGITDASEIDKIPYGCVKQGSCPTPKYAVFRKSDVSAMVSSGDGATTLMFDTDEIKEALRQ